jgi:hypothetical protein
MGSEWAPSAASLAQPLSRPSDISRQDEEDEEEDEEDDDDGEQGARAASGEGKAAGRAALCYALTVSCQQAALAQQNPLSILLTSRFRGALLLPAAATLVGSTWRAHVEVCFLSGPEASGCFAFECRRAVSCPAVSVCERKRSFIARSFRLKISVG